MKRLREREPHRCRREHCIIYLFFRFHAMNGCLQGQPDHLPCFRARSSFCLTKHTKLRGCGGCGGAIPALLQTPPASPQHPHGRPTTPDSTVATPTHDYGLHSYGTSVKLHKWPQIRALAVSHLSLPRRLGSCSIPDKSPPRFRPPKARTNTHHLPLAHTLAHISQEKSTPRLQKARSSGSSQISRTASQIPSTASPKLVGWVYRC